MCGAFLLQIGVRVAHDSIDLDPRVSITHANTVRAGPDTPGDDKGRVETLMAKNTSFRVMTKGEKQAAQRNNNAQLHNGAAGRVKCQLNLFPLFVFARGQHP